MKDSYCIDKKIIGTEKHLLFDGHAYTWSTFVPNDFWYLSGNFKITHDLCLDSLLKLNNHEIRLLPPEEFVNAFETVNLMGNLSPRWQLLMPKKAHRTFLKRLARQVEEALVSISQEYYDKVWVPGNKVLKSLQRAKIDVHAYAKFKKNQDGNVAALLSFEPDSNAFTFPVSYDRFGSRTGRLNVLSGPQILTLKKEHRKVLTSRYGDEGVIINFDFANLEPRILLYEAGKRCDDHDLYSQLNKELFGGEVERKLVKGAVISELYGINKYALAHKLQQPIDVINVLVKGIQSHFQVGSLLNRVKQEFIENGYMTNRYGRKIAITTPVDKMFINSYAQSTGVDVAMLGFDQIIEKCKGHEIVPLFVLVDALILDVHKDELSFIQGIDNLKLPGYVQKFPMTYDILNKG